MTTSSESPNGPERIPRAPLSHPHMCLCDTTTSCGEYLFVRQVLVVTRPACVMLRRVDESIAPGRSFESVRTGSTWSGRSVSLGKTGAFFPPLTLGLASDALIPKGAGRPTLKGICGTRVVRGRVPQPAALRHTCCIMSKLHLGRKEIARPGSVSVQKSLFDGRVSGGPDDELSMFRCSVGPPPFNRATRPQRFRLSAGRRGRGKGYRSHRVIL